MAVSRPGKPRKLFICSLTSGGPLYRRVTRELGALLILLLRLARQANILLRVFLIHLLYVFIWCRFVSAWNRVSVIERVGIIKTIKMQFKRKYSSSLYTSST